MADNDDQNIDRSDKIRHADSDARQAAIERMKKAMAEKEKEEKNPEKTSENQDSNDSDEDGGFQKLVKLSEDEETATNRKLVEQLKASQKDVLASVKIYSPYHTYFDGEAKSISAVNQTGPFDILPGHKNFMTLLTSGEVIIRTDRGEEKLKIDRGVMHVRDNTIKVFLDV